MPRDWSDKVPDLIRAAQRARDDWTALLLLQKAKEIDPQNLDIYRLRARLFERRGEEDRMLDELRAASDVDPTAWDVRYQLLGLEFARQRDLRRAGGIVEDLIWQKRLPPRLFNSPRGPLRSASEFAFDSALLGRLAMPEEGEGPIEMGALAAGREGELLALVSSEPWLVRIGADGALRFGIDLWMAEEERAIEQPVDVAAAPGGGALVADGFGRSIRRFDEEGRYIGPLGGPLPAPPVALDATREGEILVLDANGALRRLDAAGRAVGRAILVVGPRGAALEARGAGLAAGPRGTAYVVDGRGGWLAVYARGKRTAASAVALEAAARAPRGGGAARKSLRRGIAVGADGSAFVLDPTKKAIRRTDPETGATIETIGPKIGPIGRLERPRDVALDAMGVLFATDAAGARILRRSPEGEWGVLFALGTGKGE